MGPFYGFNRSGATITQGTIQNRWRQSMVGFAYTHCDNASVALPRPSRKSLAPRAYLNYANAAG